MLPVAAAAQTAGGGRARWRPRRAGGAVRRGRNRGFARVTEQAGVGFAREHQSRGRGASPVGAVTGRAGEFPAGTRRPAGLDERRVDARPPRLHRDGVRPEGGALGIERVLRRVAVEAQRLPGRHQLRRADPARVGAMAGEAGDPAPGREEGPGLDQTRHQRPARPRRRSPPGDDSTPRPAPGPATSA